MRNIKIIIEYDGTNYSGWERQPNGVTIQETIENAIKKVTDEETRVQGSGRTDAGVHARGQVANFRTASTIPAGKLLLAINAHLPNDIVVKKIEEVPENFHAQFNAKSKTYRYTVLNSRTGAALDRRQVYVFKAPLDERRMAEAAQCLIGEHDFRSFTTEARTKTNTVRTITDLRIERHGERITFTIEASGFLYNMVRAIVGTLLDIGRGKLEVSHMRAILDARDRAKAGPTAPAKGLCLLQVKY